MPKKPGLQYTISLRYKLALPVSIFVFLILILLTHTTIRVVRDFVIEAFESRIFAEAEGFVEVVERPFLQQDFAALQSQLDAFAIRKEIFGIRIIDQEGLKILQSPVSRELPFIPSDFFGAKPLFSRHSLAAILLQLETSYVATHFRKFPNLFVTAAPIRRGARTQVLGTAQIFFTSDPVNEMIRRIYQKRILFSVLASLGVAFLTVAVTWLAIRPLFLLGRTVQDILRGKTEARARIHSGDEIEELAEAFNEMVGRLEQSLKNLRSRSEALEESEERYRALVENATDVIWLLSPHGEIIFINQSFPGISQKNLLGEGMPLFLSFNTEESIQKFEAALDQIREHKTPVDHVATVFRHPQTHQEIFYSTNLTPVLTREGELRAIQAATRDVTEPKRIEMMKDRLVRDVAHELKTPVAKFQMTLSWLEKELVKEQKGRFQEVLDLMKRNADLLMKIIMEIMDLSRLEFGNERLIRSSCDLNHIVGRVCDDLEPLVREKELTLERKLVRESLPLEGDEAMLYRLFSNLVVNALKFTPQGKIVVATAKNHDALLASVSDTGIGLEKEDLERVFDRFFQKAPATHGMGVGLALAREIAILHGGRIWAESAGLGKGSTFFVEFPQ